MKTKNNNTNENETPFLGDAFLKMTPERTRLQRLADWWEAYDVDDHPIICCLIAAATGLAWGWVFGSNI